MLDLKEQEIPLVAIIEEKILPIVSLKEKLKQNKLKDRAGDSLLSSKPSTTIVIDDSGDASTTIVIDNSGNNNNNTILLLVPIASYQSLSGEFAKFKYYIGIATAAGKDFILLPWQDIFRNKTDVRKCLICLLPRSGLNH